MKKLFVVLGFILLPIIEVSAHEQGNFYAQQETGTFTIQPKIGLNVATIINEEYIYGLQKTPIYGLAAGIEAEYQFVPHFGFSFGAIYSVQGVKAITSISGVSLIETDKVDYINIPLIAKIYFAKEFAVNIGIQPAFKINDSYTFSTIGVNLKGSLSNTGIDMRSFYFSIPVGFSIEIHQVAIDARYLIGISDIDMSSKDKHSVFQFTLGYKFKIK